MSQSLYIFLAILLAAAVTFLLRAFPFLAFGHGSKPPPAVEYLGRVISPAAIAMLVVYCYCSCFGNKTLTECSFGIPEFASGLLVIILHLKFKNSLISIISGTALYMVLIQTVFQV